MGLPDVKGSAAERSVAFFIVVGIGIPSILFSSDLIRLIGVSAQRTSRPSSHFIFPPYCPPRGTCGGELSPPHPLLCINHHDEVRIWSSLGSRQCLISKGKRLSGKALHSLTAHASTPLCRGGAGEELWSPAAPLEGGRSGGESRLKDPVVSLYVDPEKSTSL
jgi:hypothetical protein